MGKKKAEEMARQREIFVKGCATVNNIPAAKANQIFDLLEKFAGYGFNKSHAAAYAIVAYQTAWLKANYPVEFLSAMMTNDMGDTAKLGVLIGEARKFGIEVLPPDINESGVFFTPSAAGTAGRPGAGHPVRTGGDQGRRRGGGGKHPGGARQGGKFGSLADLCERVDGRTVNRKVSGGADQVRGVRLFRRERARRFFAGSTAR